MSGLAYDTRADGGLPKDFWVRTVLIGSSSMAKLGAEATNQQQYGATGQPLFTSMDEALTYIHSDLSSR